MAPRKGRQYWVNAFWADISAQLRRLSVIEPSLYDGLQLTRDGALGYWLVEELRQKYEFFGKDCNWITVIVCPLHEGSKIDWKLEWWLRRPGGVATGSIQTYSTIKPLIESNISFDTSGSSHSRGPSEIPASIARGMKRVFGPGNPEYDYWDRFGEANYAVGGEVEGNISKLSGNGESTADKTMPYPTTTVEIKQDTSPKRRHCEGNDDGAENQGTAKKINVKGRRQLR